MVNRQIRRFLVVGSLTVLVDLASYRLCLETGLPVPLAKTIGFLTGTIFAYFVNRFWTFQSQRSHAALFKFLLLYLSTLLTNVGVNQIVFEAVPAGERGQLFAFVVATSVSATLNFLGMKYIVFRKKGISEDI